MPACARCGKHLFPDRRAIRISCTSIKLGLTHYFYIFKQEHRHHEEGTTGRNRWSNVLGRRRRRRRRSEDQGAEGEHRKGPQHQVDGGTDDEGMCYIDIFHGITYLLPQIEIEYFF